MRVLVAGGAGYIGSTVAGQLLEAGHEVMVYDSLVKGHRESVPVGACLCVGDIHDRAALDDALDGGGFDAIVHFAAYIEAGESMVDPGRYFQNNVAGSINLIEAATSHGIGRFVFSSTAAVYASKDGPLLETDPLDPANAYGASKLMVEQVFDWYARAKGLRFAALRYFNACGAMPERGENHHPETHLIPLVLQVALGQREQRVDLWHRLPDTRRHLHPRLYPRGRPGPRADLLALDALARHERLICNLGNGSGFSVREVIETARRVTGHPIPARETPRRPGDAAVLVADATRAHSLLGWTPEISDLAVIIADAWAWHSQHPHGYGD